jgi:hypothetical protein
MRKLSMALGVTALLFVGALPALADDDYPISVLLGNPARLAQELGLDSAQRVGLRQLAKTANTIAKPLLNANAELLDQIQGELAAASPNSCTIGQLQIERHQNWLKAKAAYLEFNHDFSAILTADQLKVYEGLLAAVAAAESSSICPGYTID